LDGAYRATADAEHPGSAWTAAAVTAVLAAKRCDNGVVAPAVPDVDWSDVEEAVFLHRVEGLLAPHGTQLGMPSDLAARMSNAHRRLLHSGIAAARDTDILSGVFERAGIEHLIVKGVVFMAAIGELPALRGGGDIDVWVRPEQTTAAEMVARNHGWHWRPHAEPLPEPAGGWRWRTMIYIANERPLDHPDRATLDLHWRLAAHQGELGFDFDTAQERSIVVPAVGASVRTLCLEDTFVHIAQHGRKEAWSTLRHLVDVVQLVDACGPDVTRQLAGTHRNVALALLVASRIAPRLEELADGADSRTRRLAAEAWGNCLSLAYPLRVRIALSGREAWRARWRNEYWLARSAPDWATKGAWAVKLAVPLRLLVATPQRLRQVSRSDSR
jgi:hypothetical protein